MRNRVDGRLGNPGTKTDVKVVMAKEDRLTFRRKFGGVKSKARNHLRARRNPERAVPAPAPAPAALTVPKQPGCAGREQLVSQTESKLSAWKPGFRLMPPEAGLRESDSTCHRTPARRQAAPDHRSVGSDPAQRKHKQD